MSNLTIKGLSPDVHEALRQAADRSHRSLNSEVIHRLEQSLARTPMDPDELAAQARMLRERARLPYRSDDQLREDREDGRE